jgi:hypothetical protein
VGPLWPDGAAGPWAEAMGWARFPRWRRIFCPNRVSPPPSGWSIRRTIWRCNWLTGGVPYLALLALAAWRIVPGVVARWRAGAQADRVLADAGAVCGREHGGHRARFPRLDRHFALLLGLAWGGRER